MNTQAHSLSSKGNPDEAGRLDARFLAVFLPGFALLYLYSLGLIESKYSVFLHLQPFRTGRPMNAWETIAFVVLFSVELLALLSGLSLLLWRLYRSLFRRGRNTAAWLIPLLVLSGWFLAITLQFEVLRYFRDGLDLMLARKLGGGNLMAAIHYAMEELAHLLPLLGGGILLLALIVFLALRYGKRLLQRLEGARGPNLLLRFRPVLGLNLAAFVAAFGTAFFLPVLDRNLGHSLAHHLYLAPWATLTDFDGDGYGLIPPPPDQAPFDGRRHPYALEILANGRDEDGVGGDLRENIWPGGKEGSWRAGVLKRRNVLLIVLESARADLYRASYKGQWVMPVLRSLPGEELRMVSHTAFTAPAIVSIFNGTVSPLEPGISLVERFSALGYRTGIFSAQNEGFGGQDEKTGMTQADVFFDARSGDPDRRMYLSSSSIALALPSPEVLSRAREWLGDDDSRPFFAYINLQELHYPYAYDGMPRPLLKNPVPRYAIEESERPWVEATYYNAARVVDSAIGELIGFLKERGLFNDTVILIVGDHGEELFDNGSLGHGTRISWEQNSPLGKLVNAGWSPPADVPMGLSEISTLLHNALVKRPDDALPVKEYAIAFLGVRKPLQLGLFEKGGLTRYDFRKNRWSMQTEYGGSDRPSPPDFRLIHLWESYLLKLNAQK